MNITCDLYQIDKACEKVMQRVRYNHCPCSYVISHET